MILEATMMIPNNWFLLVYEVIKGEDIKENSNAKLIGFRCSGLS
jgi:hypothetical protein